MSTSSDIVWQDGEVSRAERQAAHGHRGATLWFTGLSGAGKSSIAARVEALLLKRGCFCYLLDGDNVRHGLNRDLGFSAADRTENIRRIGHVAQLFTDAGALVLTAFISPFRSDRQLVRQLQAPGDFIEVHVAAPLEVCEQRDPKGLYGKARRGDIADFTGITSPYEPPEAPELVLHSERDDVDTCAQQVIDYLQQGRYLQS